jgi:restriction system protein
VSIGFADHNHRITKCVIWISLFMSLSGYLWPETNSLLALGLACIGLIHLVMLVYDHITSAKFYDKMTPHEFEQYCAAVLREQNWEARVTQASRDQGVDIIAQKRSMRIVLQCKKYAKPVGNHAVQEIAAAIAHEDAQRGIVVTTSSFTSAAKKLADSNQVILLHHSQLGKIDKYLRN